MTDKFNATSELLAALQAGWPCERCANTKSCTPSQCGFFYPFPHNFVPLRAETYAVDPCSDEGVPLISCASCTLEDCSQRGCQRSVYCKFYKG